MTLFITYRELKQIIADILHQDVTIEYIEDNIIKISQHSTVEKWGVNMQVDSSAELELSLSGHDLNIEYRLKVTSGLMYRLINAVAPNIVNLALEYLQSKYPQYNDIVEKVPNADRLCVHFEAIPQLHNVLQYVVLDSIIPQRDGVQLLAHIKTTNM